MGESRYNDMHAPAGSSTGGQFTSGGGGSSAKKTMKPKAAPKKHTGHTPAHSSSHGTLAYDPHTGKGPGYGEPNGDPQVHKLQQALTRLGITDSAGKELKDDGKLGPKTTTAVKKGPAPARPARGREGHPGAAGEAHRREDAAEALRRDRRRVPAGRR